MIELTMEAVYPLNETTIDRLIPPNTIGNYVLGYQIGKTIQVKYVGRSDTDLNRRLKEHLTDDPYDAFMFNVQSTPEEAYIEECWNWHGCDGPQGRLDNQIHPDKPESCTKNCPVCGK